MNNKLYDTLNNDFLIYLLIGVLLYMFCIFNIVPKSLKNILNYSILKILYLCIILYVSTINFNYALLLTIVYFGLQNSLQYENFNNMVSHSVIDPSTGNEITNSDGSVRKEINEVYSSSQIKDGIKQYGEFSELTTREINSIQRTRLKCGTSNPNVEPSFRKYNIDDAVCGESANEKFDLEPVSLCAVNKPDKAPYYLREAIKPCIAAFGKTYKKECSNKTAGGKCKDINGNTLDLPQEALDEQMNSGTVASNTLLAPIKDSNELEIKPHTLDTIKNEYLRIPEVVGSEIGNEPFRDIENIFYYKVSSNNEPNPISVNSAIPKLKLIDAYEYAYEYYPTTCNDSATPSSIPFILSKSTYEGTSTTNSSFIPRKNPNIPDLRVVFDSDVNTIYTPIRIIIKEKTGNKLYDLGFYRMDNNNSYEMKIYNYECPITTYPRDSLDVTSFSPLPFAIDSSTGIFLKEELNGVVQYHPEFDGKLYIKQDKVINISKYIKYKPFSSSQQEGTDAYLEDITDYTKKKNLWENETSKLIMRSIGCHRLRDKEHYHYGYWNNDKNKCEYDIETDHVNQSYTTVG